MENESFQKSQHPKVVIDYKNNAINAVISSLIGIGLTSIAQYLSNRAERRSNRKFEEFVKKTKDEK